MLSETRSTPGCSSTPGVIPDTTAESVGNGLPVATSPSSQPRIAANRTGHTSDIWELPNTQSTFT